MKRFLKIAATLVIFMVLAVQTFAQTPTYSCVATADTLLTSKIYQFDVYLYRTGSTELYLNNYQLSFKISNSAGILNGGTITGAYVAGSSELPSAFLSGSVSIFSVGGAILIRVNGCPASSNGVLIPTSGLKIGSFRITNTNDYGQMNPNTIWWNSNPAATHVFAIVPPAPTGTVAEITHIAYHSTLFTDPTFNALVSAYNVIGNGSFCAGTGGIPVSIDGSQVGVMYRLVKDGSPIGSTIPGTGSALSFGNQTAGNYTVTAYRKATYLTRTMDGNAEIHQITITPVISGSNAVCTGTSGVIYTTEAGMTNYSWAIDGGIITAGGTSTDNTATVTWTTAGPDNISVNYTSGACTPVSPTSYPVTVGVNFSPGITGNNAPCMGVPGAVYTTEPGMTGYDWTVSPGGTITDGSGTNVITVVWNAPGTQSVNVNYIHGGCTSLGPTTYPVTVKNSVGTPTAITISSGTEPTCQLTNETTTTTYATTASYSTGFNWSLSNDQAGTIGATTGVMTWANGFSGPVDIRVSANGCNSPSAQVTRTVNITPTVTINAFSPATSARCQGEGSVTTTTTANNSTGITYSLDEASLTGGNTINPATGKVTYESSWHGTTTITASAAGCNGPATTTHVVTINREPTLSGVSQAAAVCAGFPATINLTGLLPGSTSTVTYSINSVAQTPVTGVAADGAGAASFTSSILTVANNGQILQVTGITNTSVTPNCSESFAKNANLSVNPLPAAFAGNSRAICNGTSTTLGAAPVVGNTYSWTSVPAGFTSTAANPVVSPLEPTTYTLVETVVATGCSNTNYVAISINPLPAAVAGTDRSVCLNVSTTIGATAVGGSTYSWTSMPSGYTSTVANPTVTPLVTTTYTVVETITATGCTNSHSVVVTLLPTPVLVTNPQAACAPNKVDLTAPAVTAGSTLYGATLSYWMDGGATIPVPTPASVSAGTYYIKALTSAGCSDIKPVTATINPLPSVFTVTGGGSFCSGGTGVAVGLSTSRVGFNYTLWISSTQIGASVPGTGNPITFGLQTQAGSYWVQSESMSTHCTNRMSNYVTVTIDPLLPVSVSIAASANPAVAGTLVTFTASPVNGGPTPSYQWLVNGFNAGTNSPVYSFMPVNGDEVSCVLTSSATCISGNPATSNTVSMTVTGVPVNANVTGNVGNGQSKCYNASQTLTIAGSGTTFIVKNGGSATMIAGLKISYLPDVKVELGGYMLGKIFNGSYCGQKDPALVSTVAGEDEHPSITENSSFILYPNPTSGKFTIEYRDTKLPGKVKVEIYGLRGEKVKSEEYTREKKHRFWLPDLQPGLYIVKVIAEENAETFKLMIVK